MSFPRQQARTRRFTLGVPRAFGISPDGRRVTFLRGRDGTDGAACLWLLDLDTGTERVIADPRALTAGADEDLPPEERARRERLRETGGGIVAYSVDDAFTRTAFTLSGRLYYADLVGDSPGPHPLPAAGAVVDPRICPRGESVAYVSGGSLRTVAISSGTDRALAEPGEDGEDGVTWGLADFIAAEEMGRYRGMWWSPDGSAVLAARVDESPVERWHIADPADPAAAPQTIAYPAAGTPNADVRLAVLPLDAPGEPQWLEWDRDALPYLVDAGWTTGPDGTPTVLVTAQNRAQTVLTVFSADPATGLTAPIHTETDGVWVEIMPGVPAATSSGAHVRIGPAEGGERRLLIDGAPVGPDDLYVRGVVDVDGPRVVFAASRPSSPGRTELWLADTELGTTGPIEVPAAGEGGLDSGRMRGGTLVLQRRSLNTDGVRTLVVTDAHTETRASVTEIASFAQTPELPAPAPLLWRAGERAIPSALVLPSWFDREGEHADVRLPVLVDPYGGPHAQRVVEGRAAYLTSQWFAEQGFAVVIADGRGTPGVSVAWEQEVHGDLAGPVLEDQVAAVHDAAERFGCLDLDRVGIRGWSFGGYLSALAVLRRPDVFHAAVAGAPVIDWRLYDTHYTERYLGLPDKEEDHYRRSSLLGDAAGLDRPLMLVHGLADDNVVFAHSQRLSSALLAAGRPHTVLPLSGVTHMPTDEATAENLLLLQVDFLKSSLGGM